MRVIDAHVHLYPEEVGRAPEAWADAHAERHWARLCTRRRRDGRPVQGFPSLKELLGAMDDAGIERAVLLGWYWENHGTCAAQNRFYAACVRSHPDRLSGFATVHPAAGGESVLGELRRARNDGLIGVGELSPHSQGYSVGDRIFQEVLALAGDLGMSVNLHVTDPEAGAYPGRIGTPAADFVSIARGFPGTTFILAHWAGMLPLRDARFAALENVYCDTAASPLMYDSGVWGRAVGAIGASRVLFGSDFPLNLYPSLEEEPELVRLVNEARHARVPEAVLGGNAARMFRL